MADEDLAAVAKVNVVHHQKLALERGVEDTPTVDVYADGERVERIEGGVKQPKLVELVEEYWEQPVFDPGAFHFGSRRSRRPKPLLGRPNLD